SVISWAPSTRPASISEPVISGSSVSRPVISSCICLLLLMVLPLLLSTIPAHRASRSLRVISESPKRLLFALDKRRCCCPYFRVAVALAFLVVIPEGDLLLPFT